MNNWPTSRAAVDAGGCFRWRALGAALVGGMIVLVQRGTDMHSLATPFQAISTSCNFPRIQRHGHHVYCSDLMLSCWRYTSLPSCIVLFSDACHCLRVLLKRVHAPHLPAAVPRVVLSDRGPLPLAQVRPPSFPILLPFRVFFQPVRLCCV